MNMKTKEISTIVLAAAAAGSVHSAPPNPPRIWSRD